MRLELGNRTGENAGAGDIPLKMWLAAEELVVADQSPRDSKPLHGDLPICARTTFRKTCDSALRLREKLVVQ
jgi:hypothetical protein